MSIGINGLASYIDTSAVSSASGTDLSKKLQGAGTSESAADRKSVV